MYSESHTCQQYSIWNSKLNYQVQYFDLHEIRLLREIKDSTVVKSGGVCIRSFDDKMQCILCPCTHWISVVSVSVY